MATKMTREEALNKVRQMSLPKETMAFTARMFYMYPDVARQWYDNLPKVTLD